MCIRFSAGEDAYRYELQLSLINNCGHDILCIGWDYAAPA